MASTMASFLRLSVFLCVVYVYVINTLAFQPLYARTRMSENEFSRRKWRPKATWEKKVANDIAAAAKQAARSTSPYMVAVVGIPGSGKTTSASLLGDLLEAKSIATMIMPFDGYHYSMKELKMFPDSQDAIYRRGAPDTFDDKALQRDLDRIRNGNEDIIKVPGFDHAKGDPEPDQHMFDRSKHRVVICEGLYLLHDHDGWKDIQSVFDCSIFVNANVDVCVERLKVRNKAIPGYTAEEIDIRCEVVDRANAMTVMDSKARADVVVESGAT